MLTDKSAILVKQIDAINRFHKHFVTFIMETSKLTTITNGLIQLNYVDFDPAATEFKDNYKFLFLRNLFKVKFDFKNSEDDKLHGRIKTYAIHKDSPVMFFTIFFDHLGNACYDKNFCKLNISSGQIAAQLLVHALLSWTESRYGLAG